MRNIIVVAALVAALVFGFISCEGPAGPTGRSIWV